MLIHMAVCAAKVPFMHLFGLSVLLWPLNMYLPLSRQLPRICDAISTSSALFAFRVQRILEVPGNAPHQRQSRWERALRLFCQGLLFGHGNWQQQRRDAVVDEASLGVLMFVSL